jgi:antitoxin component YwqK of YwqJK toxin-antitoxin module
MYTKTLISIIVITLALITIDNRIKRRPERQNKCIYTIHKHSNGLTKEEGCLEDGKKQGVWKVYTEEGWLHYEWTFLNDLKNGPYTVFFNTGNINAIGNYKNGSITDTLSVFDMNGKLVSKTLWQSINNKTSKIIWQKLYNKDAKPDGTKEIISGKIYVWNLGEKLEIK